MLINLNKFPEKIFFDENFFLYLENNDLCLRTINKKQNIYIIKNAFIDHTGGIGSSHSDKILENKIEYLRNWHWMWSKYYFNKKHYGTLKALSKIFFNFFSALFKLILFSIFLNAHKRKIYFMRISGIINSIVGKKSWFRLKN